MTAKADWRPAALLEPAAALLEAAAALLEAAAALLAQAPGLLVPAPALLVPAPALLVPAPAVLLVPAPAAVLLVQAPAAAGCSCSQPCFSLLPCLPWPWEPACLSFWKPQFLHLLVALPKPPASYDRASG